LETHTAGISTDLAANRSQMNLVLATTNSLAAAIEGQRRELTSMRVLQQEVLVQQPHDAMPVEHEDRGFQTPHRELQEQGLQMVYPELQDRGLQTPYWQLSSRDAATQISFSPPPQPESTTSVIDPSTPTPGPGQGQEQEQGQGLGPGPGPACSSPTQAEPFPCTPVPTTNAWLETLSPLTTMSSIDAIPTFSVSRASQEPNTPQESVVPQAPEVLLRRSARAAPKVKKV
jgi:hypothetical protein